MAQDPADTLGHWTNENVFATPGATVPPNEPIAREGIPLRALDPNLGVGLDQNHRFDAPVQPDRVDSPEDTQVKPPHDEIIEPIPLEINADLPLNSRDVAAFIVNKMIGTGIFIQPPLVLLLTHNKIEAFFLWVLGFLYTLIATLLYLEFARRLPHTGGELIYLDETLPTPRLFAYTIYTFYFVFLYNTATNSMQFANQVLISANIHNPTFIPDNRELRFIAIVVLSFFCLLHYFSGHLGRTLNQALAFFKIILLVIVVIAGIVRANHHFTPDWNLAANSDRSSSAAAFLLILFSFTGWENATFVSNEIENFQILRTGFVSAVIIVGVLYLLVNLTFLLAVPYSALIGPNAITAYVPLLFEGGLKARLTWSILIAFSASGSLLSVIYTSARVKQVIGLSNVIPWSKIWKSTSPIPPPRRNRAGAPPRPTPKGGLILHWIFSVILISSTAGMYNLSEAIGFPGNLQAYASGWVGIFISIGFPFLWLNKKFLIFTARNIPAPTVRNWSNFQESWLLRSRLRKGFFALLYLAFNLYAVIVPLIGPYLNSSGDELEVKGWYYIVIVGSIFTAATLYYLFAFGYKQNYDRTENVVYPKRSIVRVAGALPRLHENGVHDPTYGWRRWVEIHYESDTPSYMYWIFGGHETDLHPQTWIVRLWDRLMGH